MAKKKKASAGDKSLASDGVIFVVANGPAKTVKREAARRAVSLKDCYAHTTGGTVVCEARCSNSARINNWMAGSRRLARKIPGSLDHYIAQGCNTGKKTDLPYVRTKKRRR